jgi:hypothetical protein
MNDSNKAVRKLLYKDLTFLGTSDWAVDLQSEDGDSSSSGSSGGGTVYIDPGIWSSASLLVTAIPGMTLIWPPKPLPTPTTISFPLWTTTVSYSSLTTLTSTLTNGVTSTYPWYIYVSIFTTISIPAGEFSSFFNACTLANLAHSCYFCNTCMGRYLEHQHNWRTNLLDKFCTAASIWHYYNPVSAVPFRLFHRCSSIPPQKVIFVQTDQFDQCPRLSDGV